MHLSWNDYNHSHVILSQCIGLLEKHTSDCTQYALPIVTHILTLKDNISQWRVALAMNYDARGYMHFIKHQIKRSIQYSRSIQIGHMVPNPPQKICFFYV